MTAAQSPYRPGAGVQPPNFAGRDRAVENLGRLLAGIESGGYERPRAITGIRGLGKTVLLRHTTAAARASGWRVVEIETRRRKPVDELLMAGLNRVVAEANPTADAVKRLLRGLRSAATISVRTHDPIELEWTLTAQERQGETGRDAGAEFVDVLRGVTRLAAATGNGLLIAIDELHESPPGQLEALMMALHLLENESDLPLAFIAAGLPTLPAVLVHERTYAERLFVIDRLTSLQTAEVCEAIQKPALEHGRRFSEDALKAIDEITLGYPHLVQEWADQLWRGTETEEIGLADVNRLRPQISANLDGSLYAMRHSSLTPREREFVEALASLPQDASVGAIAKKLGRKTTDVSTVRQRLLDKGTLVAVARGRLTFTLPGYRDYVQRVSNQQISHGLRL